MAASLVEQLHLLSTKYSMYLYNIGTYIENSFSFDP